MKINWSWGKLPKDIDKKVESGVVAKVPPPQEGDDLAGWAYEATVADRAGYDIDPLTWEWSKRE